MYRDIKNRDGSVDTIEITSNDSYTVNICANYKLANYEGPKNRFKNSMVGSDIGIHSKGFISVAIISTLLSLSMIIIMYINFRV